jgi:acyl-ACP thioesterase
MKTYIQQHTIPCYDTDAAWRLKPASFMNYAQEAAGNHAVHLGFGYDDLIKTNTAWIISRMYIQFIDTPKWREEMTLTTWHKGLNRLFYLRDFIMTDSHDNVRVKATTSWLVLNLETRRLVRDPGLMEEGTVNADNVIDTPADKVVMPQDVAAEYVMEHKVAYSDVDMNAHANNAMYMQWAMDAVEYELAASHPVKEFTVNFNHETKAGDIVSIFRAVVEKEDGIHVFVEGKVEDASSFIVEIVF